jgi:SNF2 family DNA or RNA helicase
LEKVSLDKKEFDRAIKLKSRTKENTRNNPYKPYIKHRIKWAFMNFRKFVKINEPKIGKFFKNGYFVAISYIVFLIISYHKIKKELLNQTPKESQEYKQLKNKINEKDKLIESQNKFLDSLYQKKKYIDSLNVGNQERLP